MKKKVLITGGATWIKIDEVRILTNIFTGKTALKMAQDFKKRGWEVTVLINPHCIEKTLENITCVPFRYFSEFKQLLAVMVRKNRYDMIVHSAAVSDYRLKKSFPGKIPSKKKSWILKCIPTEKLIKLIRRKAPKSFLVQFKLEYNRAALKKKALASLKENKTDLIVANAYTDLKKRYQAWIFKPAGSGKRIASKASLVPAILKFYRDYKSHIDTCLPAGRHRHIPHRYVHIYRDPAV